MITLLFGSNRFALQSEVQRLQESFEEQFGPAGVEKFDGDDLAPARLGELLQGVSLFSSERMVILRSPGQQRALWDSLGEWVEQVPDEVHLVIVQPSPDKRTRTFKLLQQHAVLFEARELDEPSARKWVIAYGAQRKRTITPKDAAHLIARVGLDQDRLAGELDKLLLYETINQQLIDDITEATPQATAFELLDAVLAKQHARAQAILDDIRGNEDPYRLFGLFASQVHVLALVAAAGSKVPPQQIAKDGGVHPFVVSKMSRSAKSIPHEQLREIVTVMAELDDALKGSGSDPWQLLENALLRIAAR